MLDTFCEYGGWTELLSAEIPPSVIEAWDLDKTVVTGREALIQFMDVPHGRLRFVTLAGTKQKRMRPAPKLWDTGGILDIDIRVHDIQTVFDDLTDRGWSGASEPMPLPVTDFVLDECLITNADSMMIALAKRHHPPMQLPDGKKLASHVYLSAMTVKNRLVSTDFFVRQLGFTLVNSDLVVAFPSNSPNNFGVPHNFSDKFELHLDLYSPDGTRDTMCESIECVGLSGHDYATHCSPPNRGIAAYRIEVEGIDAYFNFVKKNGVQVTPLSYQIFNGIGNVKTFSTVSPDGARIEFFDIN